MDILSFFRRGPYTSWPRNFASLPDRYLYQATWQIVHGPSGVPAVQLYLSYYQALSFSGFTTFPNTGAWVANPDMTIALLLDNSGSMSEAYRDGHVYNLASSLLQQMQSARTGFDLVFYDTGPSFVGHIQRDTDLAHAIRANPPGGGTAICDALRGTVKRYRKQKGIYIIVVTDGEFNDKVAARNLIVQEFMPQLTPDNPFAFRLHFIGAGSEVDREFLEQLERAASQGGISMVAGHHHAHISHAHATMANQLTMSFLGQGLNVEFRRPDVADEDSHHIARVGQQQTMSYQTGDDDTFPFLPLQSTWMVEVAPTTASQIQFQMLYQGASQKGQATFMVPMPAPPATRPGWRIGWPGKRDPALEKLEREEHEAALARASEDLKALGRGGIPVQARQRLQELRSDANAIFSSNLDPSEMALLRRVGYRPIATVGGSAMYHVGQAFASTRDCEVPVLSHAYDEATRLAVQRMESELKMVGAHGVVGVRFNMARHEWGDKTIEVQLVGTAVMGPGPAPQEPWLCDLSGHEWWSLYRAGYEPVELVWGHCSWFVFTDQSDEWTVRSWNNSEFSHWSQALSSARTLALRRARDMARAEGANGIVGVRLERRLSEVRLTGPGEDPAYEREHHNLLVTLLGTAIKVRRDAPRAVPATAQVLSLGDGSLVPMRLLQKEADATFE